MARKMTRDELTEHCKYLAGSINDNGLLYAVFQTARSCRMVDSTLEIDFGRNRKLYARPPADQRSHDLPNEFQDLEKVHSSLRYPDESGWALILASETLSFEIDGY